MATKKKTSRSSSVGGTLKRTVRLVKDAVSGEETAIDLLKSQHEEVKALFKKIEKATARGQKANAGQQDVDMVAHFWFGERGFVQADGAFEVIAHGACRVQ